MADIKITDNVSLSADLNLRDDAPLLNAGLSSFVTTETQLFQNLGKPLDQTDVQSVVLNGTFSSPNLLSGDVDQPYSRGRNETAVSPRQKGCR